MAHSSPHIAPSYITGTAILKETPGGGREIIGENLDSEVCSIYLLRDGVLELFATVGLNQSAVHVTRLALGEGLVGTIAKDVSILNLAEAPSHPEFAYRPETGEELFHSFAGVPIIRRERAIGVAIVTGLGLLEEEHVAGGVDREPVVADVGRDSPVELGVRFTPARDGYITGLRFYKSAANVGPHVGRLWSNTGVQIASVAFEEETPSEIVERLPGAVRADAEKLGYTRGFTIYDEADSLRMMKRCMEELEIDPSDLELANGEGTAKGAPPVLAAPRCRYCAR